jgi:hypothetical protein
MEETKESVASVWSKALKDALDKEIIRAYALNKNAPIKGRSIEYLVVDDLTESNHSFLRVRRGKQLSLRGREYESSGSSHWRLFCQEDYPHQSALSLTVRIRSAAEEQSPEWESQWDIRPGQMWRTRQAYEVKVLRPEAVVKLTTS